MDLYLHAGMFVSRSPARLQLRRGRVLVELHLQFGFGMMDHSRHLVSAWNGGTVVLSPRDLSERQLQSLASEVTGARGGQVLFDPQFYLPYSDHDRLRSHSYWPEDFSSGSFFTGSAMRDLVKKVIDLNVQLDTAAILLPGMLADPIDDLWLAHHDSFLAVAREIAGGQKPIYVTLALSAEAVRDRQQITALLDAVVNWGADGFYIVCEHPAGEYLVRDAIWLAHVLDLTAGLRLAGSRVVIGYCNHQMLIAHVAGANAICSGTWMNVRSFPPEKFSKEYDDEIRRRSTWYYCPQALSEFKIPFLDVAYEQGVLDVMSPQPPCDDRYVSGLFSGVQPSSVRVSEQAAFRHYLNSLWQQARALSSASYDEARQLQAQSLNVAEDLLSTLRANGVLGANRDFFESLDVNRAALAILDKQRGPLLRRRWRQLE